MNSEYLGICPKRNYKATDRIAVTREINDSAASSTTIPTQRITTILVTRR